MKKHIDCDWLIEKEDGVYLCCDTRSPIKGKHLDEDFIQQEACEFFHPKPEDVEEGYFDNLDSAIAQ